MPKKLLTVLQKEAVPFEEVTHRIVYTAYDTAQTLRAKLTEVAKPLLLKADKGWVLAVLSAGQNIDLKKIGKIIGAKKIRIPTEKEIIAALELKKKQGLASFGSLYAIPVVLEKAFAKNASAIFSSGSFTESLKMKLKDFIKMESPIVGVFGVVKKIKKQKPQKKLPSKKSAPAKRKKIVFKKKPAKKKK